MAMRANDTDRAQANCFSIEALFSPVTIQYRN